MFAHIGTYDQNPDMHLLKRENYQKKTTEFLWQKKVAYDGSIRWVPTAGDFKNGKRQDLFGLFDIVLAHPPTGIVGIQVCARPSMSDHRKKAFAEPRFIPWLQSGGLFEIWAWAKDRTYKGRAAFSANVERYGFVADAPTLILKSNTHDPGFYL